MSNLPKAQPRTVQPNGLQTFPEDGCALCQLARQSRHSETMTILKAQSQCNCDFGLMHAADDRLKTPAPDIVFGSLSLP